MASGHSISDPAPVDQPNQGDTGNSEASSLSSANFLTISPEDPRFRSVLNAFPNAGAIVIIDTEEPGIAVFGVEGRAVPITPPIDIPQAGDAQLLSSSLFEYTVSANEPAGEIALATAATGGTQCKWMDWNGRQILISGNPNQCRR